METIIISGKSASGKDAFANMMKEKLEQCGCRILIIHFADLVKFYAKQYYNWNEVKDEAGRALLQRLGTDLIRNKYPEYWAQAVAKFLAVMNENDEFDCAFIPDARFENEIEIVKYYNPEAITIRIKRYEADETEYLNPLFTKEQHNHPSETSLDDYCEFDYYVENHSLEELQESAEFILKVTNLLN